LKEPSDSMASLDIAVLGEKPEARAPAAALLGKKIVVGMSGGVDSSMSLVLLKKKGWQPIGVSLKLPVWKGCGNPLRENVCCTAESLRIARAVCGKMNVPYCTVNAQAQFRREVMDYFVRELRHGRTPNPCAMCNRNMKFKLLLDYARRNGIGHVATGHYAKVRMDRRGNARLLRAVDKGKDQSYGLSFLTQEQLRRIIFPLGGLTKAEVYALAEKEGFDFFLKRKQSQDLCFVSGSALPKYVETKLGKKTGEIVDEKGNAIGTHEGLHFYTIGQRRGLRLPQKYYVKEFDMRKNLLVVTDDRRKVRGREARLTNLNFISGEVPEKKISVMAQARYRQKPEKAGVEVLQGGKAVVKFARHVESITPGQVCALYRGSECIGAGIIS